jgi:hypothetical protein
MALGAGVSTSRAGAGRTLGSSERPPIDDDELEGNPDAAQDLFGRQVSIRKDAGLSDWQQ